jgi:ornithine decarboxylase
VKEGDYIEIGMLGAYGVAMASRFNGFGETIVVETADAPWASMFAERAPRRDTVVTLASQKGKPKRK